MFEMKPEYYIGIKMIDEQHKQLFTYADEAYELLNDEFTPDKYDRVDILLEKLYDYTVKHLADEEAYMESIHYNKLFTQKVQHQAFIEKLDEFMESHNKEEENQDEQIMKILTYLTEWLVNHILYVDGQIPQG
ncbi:MAG: bacteriohemerythrin [Roseburia inulinivorans]